MEHNMRLLSAFLIILLAFGCSKTIQEKKLTLNEVEPVISNTLNRWHKAAGKADWDGYFGVLDSVSIFIGTDVTEVWSKADFEAFSKPYFERGKAWDFKAVERNIYLSKSANVVWFDEVLDTWMGLCRGSGVFELGNKGWKLKHYVLSVTIPNDAIKGVIEAKKEEEAKILPRYKK